MKTALFLFIALFNFAAFASSDGVKLIKTEELKGWLADSKQTVKIFDVNSDEIRKKDGYIKGATLTTIKKTPVALPQDKNSKVVFYCYNEQCMASHKAAKAAMKAGYNAVFVLSDGITGWKKKGGEIEVLN
jgi:rhodanese-related sulfurtransferase